MPLRTFTDRGGATITLIEVAGMLYPYVEGAQQENCVQQIKLAPARDNDVLLVNYPKSGTHWMWEIMSMLHNGKAESIPKIKQTSFMEALTTDQLASLPSPRILNTHMRFKDLPEDMLARKTKIVLIYRNPKDIAVSLYNHEYKLEGLYHYNGTWSDWLQSLFLTGTVSGGDWFQYVQDWEAVTRGRPDYPIHVVYYEDLKQHPHMEVEKLAKFLELPVTSELCRQIADKCSFSNMKVDKRGLENEFWTRVWRDHNPSYYRKGEVGDWKNWFTVAQNEHFDRIYRDRMIGSQLNIRFEL